MNKTYKFLVTLLVAASLLLGSTPLAFASNGPDSPPTVGTKANATVNVAHFAPFTPVQADTEVTVRVNGTDALIDFEFGEIEAGLDFAPGQYLIEIIPDILGTVAISGTFDLAADTQYSLAAIGDGANQPLELFALVDDTTPLVDAAKLRIAHLAPWAAGDALVDICVDGSTTPLIPDLGFKDFTDPYLELPAGNYDLLIAVAGTSCGTVALDIPSVTLENGDIVDVFAIGDIANYDLQVVSITGINFTPATVNVAHFAPFAATLQDTSVSVYLNGAEAIPDFIYGEIVPGVELDMGEYLVEIIPTGSMTPAITGTFMLEADVQYTLAAIGDGVNQPLELFALVDDTEALMASGVNADEAKLRVAHLAPWAAGEALVDICVDGSTTPLIANFGFKDFTDPYLELPAGKYDLLIAVAGTNCGSVALDIPAIALRGGTITDVFAIGGANDQPLTVSSITGLALLKNIFIPWVVR